MYKKILAFIMFMVLSISSLSPAMAAGGPRVERPEDHLPPVLFEKGGEDAATTYDKAVVLVLDCSGSMDGSRMTSMKAAAKAFCETTLNSDENVGIGIVRFASANDNDTAKVCGITSKKKKLETAIDTLKASGVTDIYDGTKIAYKMLSKSTAPQKFIILMTDGSPVVGTSDIAKRSYLSKKKGHYGTSQTIDSTVALQNAIYAYYTKIKKNSDYTVFTVGLSPSVSMVQFLKDLASTPSGYLTAENPDALAGAFGHLAHVIAPTAKLSNKKIGEEGDLLKYEITVTVKNPNKKSALEDLTVTLNAGEATVTKGEITQTKAKLDSSEETSFKWEIIIDKTKYADKNEYTYSVETTAKDTTAETDKQTITLGKKPNEITCKKISLTWDGKEKTFSLNATAKGGKLSYESSVSAIKVDKDGKVTISKGFLGEASITIKATGSDDYEDATKTVKLTVAPTQTYIKRFRKSGDSLIVEWKTFSNLDGYQIEIGTDSKFADESKLVYKKTIKSGKTGSVSFKPGTFEPGYYVRTRTYKTYNKKTYYSAWKVEKVGNPNS